jgi:hypothetical protein
MTGVLASPWAHNQAVPLQEIAARTSPRKARDSSFREHAQKFLGAPARVLPPQGEELLHDRQGRGRGGPMGPPRSVVQTRCAVNLEALEPLVSDPPTDAVPSAQLAEGHELPIIVADETPLLVHGRGLPPRHRPPPRWPRLLPMSPDSSVTYVPGPNRAASANNALQLRRSIGLFRTWCVEADKACER